MKLKFFADNKDLLKQYAKEEQISLICDICDNSFFLEREVVRSRIKNNKSGKYQTFCSHECNLKSREVSVDLNCTNCNAPFKRTPKELKKSKDGRYYCSRSCRAKYMNYAVLSKVRTCKGCGEKYKQPPLSGRTSQYCISCTTENRYIINGIKYQKLDDMTVADFIQKNNLGSSKSKNYHSAIRRKCRDWNDDLKKECQVCGYNKIIEYCHIKAVKDFPDTATLGEINSRDNILILCPNHHAEFDRKLLTLEQIKST